MKKLILFLSTITGILFYTNQANAITVNTIIDLSPMIQECAGTVCTFGTGTEAVMKILGGIIKYLSFIVGLLAVLFIVVNGIMYSMGGMDQSMKEEAKKRITKTLIGIIVLLMTGTILNLIAPWIYK